MKITMISALLLVGVPAAVTAAPVKQETAERVSYKDPRATTSSAEGWVELASPTPAKYGREYITVNGDFTQIRIEASSGQPRVRNLRVVFVDGKDRVVRIDRVLGVPAIVDLGGVRAIDHLIVTTDRRSKGMYVVRGAPAGAPIVAGR